MHFSVVRTSRRFRRFFCKDLRSQSIASNCCNLLVKREQELSNLLHDKKYIDAVGLAISLDQPWRVLKVFKGKIYEVKARKEKG